jgi:uncharacterized protein (DUF342 family)
MDEAKTSNDESQEPVVDGRFRLKVSRDKLAVYMDGLQAPKGGGSPVEAKRVHSKLKKLEVKYGINNKKIDEIIATLNEGHLPTPEEPPQTGTDPEEGSAQTEEDNSHLCIVKGNAPTHGKNATLKWNIDETKAQDYVVMPGELIAILSPAGQSTPGKNIYGKPVAATRGRDDTIKPGAGIEQTQAGETVEYHAKWFGKVQIEDDTMAIACPLIISDDNMKATLDFLPPSTENQALSFEHIIEVLQQHEITFGIKEDAINEALETLNKSKQPTNKLTIAEGIPVVHGIDAKLNWKINPDEISAKGYIVRPDDLIVTRRLASSGEHGRDILNNEIPATPGKDIAIKIEDNINEDETNNLIECRARTVGLLTHKLKENTIIINIDPGLTVSSNNMEAKMNLFLHASNGDPIDVFDITRSLKELGVTFGIGESSINDALLYAKEHGQESIAGTIVAQGKSPEDGTDTHIEYTEKENIAGQALNKGRIDFREHNYPWSFKKDDIIGRLFKAKPENDGSDVWGESIKAMPSNQTELELEGAHFSAPNRIIADMDGTLIINGLSLCLAEILVINGDVAQKTGNIHSKTGVHVKGYVEPGFMLESEKSIIIDNNVEDATVRSGGSITIKGGIRGLKSEVYAPGEVNAEFIENADVYVNGNITITGSIINSNVSSNNTISIGSAKSKNSAIIGGRVTAHTKVEAFTIGSSAYHKTIVSVGFTQESKQQQRDLKGNIEAKNSELTRLDQVEAHYKLHPKGNADEIMRKVSATREALLKEIESLEKELNNIMEQINQAESSRIIVHKQVFPGVTIKINGYNYEVERELSAGTFTLKNDEVVFRPE